MPCVEQIEALLGLAAGARFAGMHVNAIGAAIDLGGARLDQIDQRMVEPALLHVILERRQRLHRLGVPDEFARGRVDGGLHGAHVGDFGRGPCSGIFIATLMMSFLYRVLSNNCRPISMRRISLVPAPIS